MNPALLACFVVLAGLAGLTAGSFLRILIARVPARVPRRPLLEVATAIVFALVAWASFVAIPPGPALIPVLLAYLVFAATAIALTVVDIDVHRLPNAIVLPAYAVAAVLFTAAALLGGSWQSLARAALGGAVLFGFYLVLRLVQPRGMGMGDVKLAGLVGIHLGWIGWSAVVVGGFAAFVLGGVWGIALLVARRARLASAIPFGPWMVAGAAVGILVGERLLPMSGVVYA